MGAGIPKNSSDDDSPFSYVEMRRATKISCDFDNISSFKSTNGLQLCLFVPGSEFTMKH
jgi:hypothetical protein